MNPKSPSDIKMVSYDILLTHTSQEMFGRKSSRRKPSTTSKSDMVKKKALLSNSLQGPLFHPNVTKASGHASGSGLKLAQQLDRNHIEHNLRVGNDLKEVHLIKDSFEQKLQDISRYKAPAEETASERKTRILLLTFQMPNYVRLLAKIARNRRRRIFSQVMQLWKTTTMAHRALEKIIHGKELVAAMRVQRAWKRRKIMKKHQHEEYLAMKAQHKREHRASQQITQGLRNLMQRRVAIRIVATKRALRQEKMATQIQRVYRGRVGRAWRTECLRLLLLQDLRDWAGGNIQKLTERPTQLDIHTEDLIRKAIYLVSNRPTYYRDARPPRLLRMFRKQIHLAREREEACNAQTKVEHGRMMHERVLMAENDREDWFRRNFNNVMAELARQALAAEKLKEKRESEDAFLRKARAEVFHIIERMKLDGLLERSEREKMFREEYTQRRIDNYFKQKKIQWHEANLLLMAQEDHIAADIHAAEREEGDRKKNLMEQQQKVKDLLELEAEKEREKERRHNPFQLLDLPSEDYMQYVRLKEESLPQVASLIKDSFRHSAGSSCPNKVICNCHHEWTSSLKLMKACAKRVDMTLREAIDMSTAGTTLTGKVRLLQHNEEDGKYPVKKFLKIKKNVSKTACRVDFHWQPDRNCLQKYQRIRTLQAYRLLRVQKLKALSISGELFKQKHQSLLEVRRRLRVEKFGSRKERRHVLDQAIELETCMEALESNILTNCIEICENGRLEKMNFLNLFCVHIVSKEKTEQPKQKKKKKLPGYMQKKKQVGPIIVAGTNRHDHDRKKMELSTRTGQLVEVIDEQGDSEADDEQYSCPSACTFSPKGVEQIQVLEAAPPLPSYVLLHLHLKRTEAEQSKTIDSEKRADKEASSQNKNKFIMGKQSLPKSDALNSPISKNGRSPSPNFTTPSSSPNSKIRGKLANKRQSMNVIDKSSGFRGVNGGTGSKFPRKSMQNEPNDEDILRAKTLLADVVDVELEKVIPKEGSREIPGLSKYPSEETHLYLPLVRIEEIKKWSKGMSAWYDDVELKWKKSKKDLCLSFFQRARLLLTGGERHRQLLTDDASLAAKLHRANALDLVELLCCRSTLVMRPTASSDYVSLETIIPSRKIDMLCGKHPFSLQAYFALLLAHQAHLKNSKVKTIPMWAYENSGVYTLNNLFARLGLLTLQPQLANNAFYCSTIAKLPVPWGYEASSDLGSPHRSPSHSPIKPLCSPDSNATSTASRASSPKNRRSAFKQMLNRQKSFSAAIRRVSVVEMELASALSHEDLCNSHAYVINLFAALIAGLETEKLEEASLFNSFLSGEHLNIHSSFPRGEKDGTLMGKLRKKSNFGVKPLYRLELSPVYSIGGLVQSYRQLYPGEVETRREGEAVSVPVMNLRSLQSVPLWMFPVNYWGNPPSAAHIKKSNKKVKRGKSKCANTRKSGKEEEDEEDDEEDEELDENIYAFEEKITSWGDNIFKTLKQKANTRIKKKRTEIEAISMNINKLHMGYEDKLASTIRFENNRNYLLNETRKWKKKNGAWYRKLYNRILRRPVEAILPFNAEENLIELNASIARLQWLFERLPSQKMPAGWTLCFTRLVGEPLYDLAESQRQFATRVRAQGARRLARGSVAGVKGGVGGRAQLSTTAAVPRRHIRWTRMAGAGYQKLLLARRMNSSLGEMIICGGIRNNVLMARVVVDEVNQPAGAIMLESMELPTCPHREIRAYVNSARTGFQDRELCEGAYRSFAVTKTLNGRYLSEEALRVLRTELPGTEIESTRLRQQILWNIFKESRYHSAAVVMQVIKLQAIFRMRLALKHTRQVRLKRDRRPSVSKK